MEYPSGNAAARALGVDSGSVRACCRGRLKRTGEYEFKWAPLAEDQQDRPGEEWRDVQLADAECSGINQIGASAGRPRGRAKKGGCECPSSVM